MLPNSNRLQSLTLWRCSSLLSFPTNGLPTTLTSLRIQNCKKLEFLSREMMAKLTSLQSLYLVQSCDSLRSFPLGIFPNLSSLTIGDCENLESLSAEGGADENLSHLNSLDINGCRNLVSFPDGGLRTPNLTSLKVMRCENLKLLPDRMHTPNRPSRFLDIWSSKCGVICTMGFASQPTIIWDRPSKQTEAFSGMGIARACLSSTISDRRKQGSGGDVAQ
ncbi:hypothetical protein C1H46_013147 [Malus baccata]|uniref:Ig-like domain-containing protein n=1 Tax=Malus baccata TaxID=106549 RepID=A0A540MSA5_MALBA|nr:hypothetical protein C1H46_013147 [Malus baccata]